MHVATSVGVALLSAAMLAGPQSRVLATGQELLRDLPPRVITEVKPEYPKDAQAAGITGVVLVDALVRKDGTVGATRVVRSLDRKYGLDDRAMKAARQWRFHPATRDGEPVDKHVVLEMSFSLRPAPAPR